MGLFSKGATSMKVLKKLKKIIICVALSLVLPSTVSLAAETEPRQIETPDSVFEAVSQRESDEHVVYFPQAYNLEPSVITIAAYRDWRFTSASAKEFVDLNMACDTISLSATCTEEGVTDELVLYIMDYTHNGDFNTALTFPADGSVTTIACPLPAGHYAAYFIGDPDKQKANAIALFAKIE